MTYNSLLFFRIGVDEGEGAHQQDGVENEEAEELPVEIGNIVCLGDDEIVNDHGGNSGEAENGLGQEQEGEEHLPLGHGQPLFLMSSSRM